MPDETSWIGIRVPDPATPLGAAGSATTPTAGFRIDPAAVPQVRNAFEEAMQEMINAKRAAFVFTRWQGHGANPVVDKYLAAMIDRAVGPEGSLTTAADSAIAAYQAVIDQLDAAVATYAAADDPRRFR